MEGPLSGRRRAIAADFFFREGDFSVADYFASRGFAFPAPGRCFDRSLGVSGELEDKCLPAFFFTMGYSRYGFDECRDIRIVNHVKPYVLY